MPNFVQNFICLQLTLFAHLLGSFVNLVKYRIKDATHSYSGTQYGLFRAWESEFLMGTDHFVNVE